MAYTLAPHLRNEDEVVDAFMNSKGACLGVPPAPSEASVPAASQPAPGDDEQELDRTLPKKPQWTKETWKTDYPPEFYDRGHMLRNKRYAIAWYLQNYDLKDDLGNYFKIGEPGKEFLSRIYGVKIDCLSNTYE